MVYQQVSDPGVTVVNIPGLEPGNVAADVLTHLARLGPSGLAVLSEAGILRRAAEWLPRCDARCACRESACRTGLTAVCSLP